MTTSGELEVEGPAEFSASTDAEAKERGRGPAQ